MAETTRKGRLHHDLTAPDSLITPRQYEDRQARLDKFQRRAANPKQDTFRRHSDRLRIIDAMLTLKADPDEVDGIMAVLSIRPWIKEDREKLRQAIAILTSETPKVAPPRAEPDPLPEPDREMVDAFITNLTKTADPFRGNWSDDDGCYVMGIVGGNTELGIADNDWMHSKYKTPEPGDLVILPCDRNSKKLIVGHFISSHDDRIKIHLGIGVREYISNQPPLVVTKITKRDTEGDDE